MQIEPCKPLRFPPEVLKNGEAHLEVDVLALLGKAQLTLHKGADKCTLQVECKHEKRSVICDIEVQRNTQEHLSHCPKLGEDPVGNTEKRVNRHRNTISAQKYINDHRLLEAMHLALQVVVSERPEEPLKIMAEHFLKSAETRNAGFGQDDLIKTPMPDKGVERNDQVQGESQGNGLVKTHGRRYHRPSPESSTPLQSNLPADVGTSPSESKVCDDVSAKIREQGTSLSHAVTQDQDLLEVEKDKSDALKVVAEQSNQKLESLDSMLASAPEDPMSEIAVLQSSLEPSPPLVVSSSEKQSMVIESSEPQEHVKPASEVLPLSAVIVTRCPSESHATTADQGFLEGDAEIMDALPHVANMQVEEALARIFPTLQGQKLPAGVALGMCKQRSPSESHATTADQCFLEDEETDPPTTTSDNSRSQLR
jgi:hypothetical protein